MKTLVLCVDRDDDLGTKAGINGPVIGREENLKATIALGLADPEESDTNTILSGLQLYDDLVKRGMEAGRRWTKLCGVDQRRAGHWQDTPGARAGSPGFDLWRQGADRYLLC